MIFISFIFYSMEINQIDIMNICEINMEMIYEKTKNVSLFG